MITDKIMKCDLCGKETFFTVGRMPDGWICLDSNQKCIDLCPECLIKILKDSK